MIKKHVSIFDLDNTLISVNSSYQFGLFLYKKKIFKYSTLLYILGCNFRHKLGFLPLSKLHEEAFQKLFLGRSYSLIKKLAEQFIDRHFNQMIYEPAFDRLKKAKSENHLTIILSSSPDFLVSQIAKRFAVDQWQATSYDVDENHHFSGISQLMQGEDKALYVQKLLPEIGLTKQDVTAYSDSYLDLPFLLAAGNAVGVKPDRKLLAICKHNHWPII